MSGDFKPPQAEVCPAILGRLSILWLTASGALLDRCRLTGCLLTRCEERDSPLVRIIAER